VVQFWYRQTPRFLLSNATLGRVYSQNPPLVDSGMAGARFDMRGRLVQFYAVPPQRESVAAAGSEPDWSALFAEAELDSAQFRRVAPEWTPAFFADHRAAWEGVFPDRPEIPIRVEAAGYQGRPVWFHIVGPWTRPERMEPWRHTSRQRTAAIILLTLLVLLVAASGWLAHRNLARGRGDRAGAWRLAVYAMAVGVLGWSLWAHHVADLAGELTLITRADGVLLLIAFCIWLLYLAVEPYVRRRSPHLLISWTRLLAGRGRDAAVGRDVLVGAAGGALMSVAVVLSWRLPAWLGQPPPWPKDLHLDSFLGVRERMMTALFAQLDAAAVGLGLVVLLVLIRMVVRSEPAAVAGVLLVASIPNAFGGNAPPLTALPVSMAVMALPVFVMTRFGLLAVILTLYTCSALLSSPFSLQFDHWTGAPTAFSLAVVAALLAWGLVASASRRRLAVVHDLAA
jgi:hypothetical protein